MLSNACSKWMARSAVIGASYAHTAAKASSSICEFVAAEMARRDAVYSEDRNAG